MSKKVTILRVIRAVAVAIGGLLTWTGWTGPELLNEVAETDPLSFVSSDLFRTGLMLAGLLIIALSVWSQELGSWVGVRRGTRRPSTPSRSLDAGVAAARPRESSLPTKPSLPEWPPHPSHWLEGGALMLRIRPVSSTWGILRCVLKHPSGISIGKEVKIPVASMDMATSARYPDEFGPQAPALTGGQYEVSWSRPGHQFEASVIYRFELPE